GCGVSWAWRRRPATTRSRWTTREDIHTVRTTEARREKTEPRHFVGRSGIRENPPRKAGRRVRTGCLTTPAFPSLADRNGSRLPRAQSVLRAGRSRILSGGRRAIPLESRRGSGMPRRGDHAARGALCSRLTAAGFRLTASRLRLAGQADGAGARRAAGRI